MKNLVVALMCGFGLLSAQGCAVDAGQEGESLGTQAAALNSCTSSYGVFTTKAALAIAMADELGKWDPLNQLYKPWGGGVALSSSAVCLKNGCANTKAILGQQNFTADQSIFSDANYRNDLVASFDRQANLISDLARNSPSKLPPAHKLTKVAGPVDLGKGACGAHYVFQVDNQDGTPMSSAQASLMAYTLCYYGQDTPTRACGNNAFVGFTQTQVGCPAGRLCVAIDPSEGDNGTTTTTTAGTAPTYPMNRVYDASGALLGTKCVTTGGVATTLKSKCAATPSTCGYDYCML